MSNATAPHGDYNPSGIVECTSCGNYTTPLEAECRRFNRGRCGKCGGPLFPIERKNNLLVPLVKQ